MKQVIFYILFSLILGQISAQSTYSNLQRVSSFQELSYPFETKFAVLSNDISIAYFDEGNEPERETIIFIHGLGSYAPAWKNNLKSLSNSNRCIAIDLPGYGKSSKDDYPVSLSYYAKIIFEFADSLGIEAFHLAGHSMGAQISIVATLTNPERIKSLILVSPAGIETFTEGEKEWFRTAITAKNVMLTPLDQIEKNIGHNFYRMPKEARFMITDRYAMTGAGEEFQWYCNAIPKCVSAMVDEPVIRDLPNITQRTLIIMGEADQLIPNRYLHGRSTRSIAEKGHQLIPNSEMRMVKKAGHFVMFEKPEEVNQYIVDFLSIPVY